MPAGPSRLRLVSAVTAEAAIAAKPAAVAGSRMSVPSPETTYSAASKTCSTASRSVWRAGGWSTGRNVRMWWARFVPPYSTRWLTSDQEETVPVKARSAGVADMYVHRHVIGDVESFPGMMRLLESLPRTHLKLRGYSALAISSTARAENEERAPDVAQQRPPDSSRRGN